MLMSWEDFINTYHQDPNSSTPFSLAVLYTPIQKFIDQAIMTFKTSKKLVLSYSSRQFPNLEYYLDSRLTVSFLISINCRVCKVFFLCTWSLLFHSPWSPLPVDYWRSAIRVSIANDWSEWGCVVHFLVTYYYHSFNPCRTHCSYHVINLGISEYWIWCASHLYAYVQITLDIWYSVSLNTSSFSMSLTSLFDKPDTGAGVILLILLFGAMPAVFLTVLMERWTEL